MERQWKRSGRSRKGSEKVKERQWKCSGRSRKGSEKVKERQWKGSGTSRKGRQKAVEKRSKGTCGRRPWPAAAPAPARAPAAAPCAAGRRPTRRPVASHSASLSNPRGQPTQPLKMRCLTFPASLLLPTRCHCPLTQTTQTSPRMLIVVSAPTCSPYLRPNTCQPSAHFPDVSTYSCSSDSP